MLKDFTCDCCKNTRLDVSEIVISNAHLHISQVWASTIAILYDVSFGGGSIQTPNHSLSFSFVGWTWTGECSLFKYSVFTITIVNDMWTYPEGFFPGSSMSGQKFWWRLFLPDIPTSSLLQSFWAIFSSADGDKCLYLLGIKSRALPAPRSRPFGHPAVHSQGDRWIRFPMCVWGSGSWSCPVCCPADRLVLSTASNWTVKACRTVGYGTAGADGPQTRFPEVLMKIWGHFWALSPT